ncbi:MAG TPA: hypothetical protein VKN76_16910 [Kiloniellaceae bacterium]|nr:hypothetical protein [Kiloniellaceae bacterium]
MTPEQTQAVLTKCAAYDRRTVSRTDVLAWHAIIGHQSFDACLGAVEDFYGEYSHHAMPADIRKLAVARSSRARAVDARTKRALEVVPDSNRAFHGPDLIRHVLRELKAAGQDAANGHVLGKDRAADIAEKAAEDFLAHKRKRRP